MKRNTIQYPQNSQVCPATLHSINSNCFERNDPLTYWRVLSVIEAVWAPPPALPFGGHQDEGGREREKQQKEGEEGRCLEIRGTQGSRGHGWCLSLLDSHCLRASNCSNMINKMHLIPLSNLAQQMDCFLKAPNRSALRNKKQKHFLKQSKKRKKKRKFWPCIAIILFQPVLECFFIMFSINLLVCIGCNYTSPPCIHVIARQRSLYRFNCV